MVSLPNSGQPTTTGLRPVQIAASVVAVSSDHVYRADRERALQDAIEIVLRGAGFRVEREFRLNDRDGPDFLVDKCVAVEVKMRASGSDPVMLETLDVKSMQADLPIDGAGDGVAQLSPEAMTPERYEQIRRLASRFMERADRGLTARRTA